MPTLTTVVTRTSQASARRPRAYVRVAGPDAEDYLQRMVSNDVEAVTPGESCEALAAVPDGNKGERLLVGGEGHVWQYRKKTMSAFRPSGILASAERT